MEYNIVIYLPSNESLTTGKVVVVSGVHAGNR